MKIALDTLKDFPEFDAHNSVYHLTDDASGLDAYVAIHRKNPVQPSFGATRLWPYSSSVDGLRDALRLAYLMSHKAALAGLPCGGAKATIVAPKGDYDRPRLLSAYAMKLRELADIFVTGTDVGISQDDLVLMKKYTPNIVGFSDNSTPMTARGVYGANVAAIRKVFNQDSIKDRTFAVQGLGKVGFALVGFLAAGGSGTIYVADLDPLAIAKTLAAYPQVVVVDPGVIHAQRVDVFCPCAMAHAIRETTLPDLSCAIVAGCANNQLSSPEIGDALFKRGITYVPDYIGNAGGLIAVFDEYENAVRDDVRVLQKVDTIGDRVAMVMDESHGRHIGTHRVADEMAERILKAYV